MNTTNTTNATQTPEKPVLNDKIAGELLVNAINSMAGRNIVTLRFGTIWLTLVGENYEGAHLRVDACVLPLFERVPSAYSMRPNPIVGWKCETKAHWSGYKKHGTFRTESIDGFKPNQIRTMLKHFEESEQTVIASRKHENACKNAEKALQEKITSCGFVCADPDSYERLYKSDKINAKVSAYGVSFTMGNVAVNNVKLTDIESTIAKLRAW